LGVSSWCPLLAGSQRIRFQDWRNVCPTVNRAKIIHFGSKNTIPFWNSGTAIVNDVSLKKPVSVDKIRAHKVLRGSGMFQLRIALLVLALISTCCSQQPTAQSKPPRSVQHALADADANCDKTTTPPPDSSFPKGFDYPQSAQTVESWVTTPAQGDRMRLHAWCLFAGLNLSGGPNGPLHWQKWKTSTQAFPYQYNPWKGGVGGVGPAKSRPAPLNARNLANAKVGGPNAINNPAPIYPINAAVYKKYQPAGCTQLISEEHPDWGYQLRDGVHMQSNGDIMIAGVIYNDAAIKNILGTNLYNANVLTAGLPKDKTSPPNAIPQMPASSIVLKPMFWPVQQTGFTALPVWDWDANKPGSPSDGQYAGYEMQKFWNHAVAITAAANPTPPPKIQYLYGVYNSDHSQQIGPITYDNTSQISPPAFQVVSVNDFYHEQLTQTQLNALSPCDRAILDASAWWAYGREFRAGDYLVLIAMHIMTKEQPDWTFQSLWYHPDANKPNCGRYCKSRPTNLTDKTFQHYFLTTTYGTVQQEGHENYYSPPYTKPGSQLWPVAYNPYIELAASHPITTNCMNCHHRAAWPPFLPGREIEGRVSSYLPATPPNPPNPNVLETFQENDSTFNGLLTLDAMWAISDRGGYPKAGPKPPTKKTAKTPAKKKK
jgi:hypothetical protein